MSKKQRSNQTNRNDLIVYVVLLVAAFSFRVAIARFLPNDAPDDGRIYAQIARNVLEQHVYSHDSEPPFAPTLIRLPGYPLLLAGLYSLFGHNDNQAVRVVQALIDTGACALIALLAFYWDPDEKRRRASSIAALALAAVCPFSAIYVATILTEIPTMFLSLAMCLTATVTLKAKTERQTLLLWLATGVIAGVAVLFRPDSGLFAAAIGVTLVTATLVRAGSLQLGSRAEKLHRIAQASFFGAVFSLAFCLVLVPWTIRNYRVFHLFQPLAPAHAEMPGEFVPRGYLKWVRTWIDDERYIGPTLWALDTAPLKITDYPEYAFNSNEEKARVNRLLEQYNHPVDESQPPLNPTEASPQETPEESPEPSTDETDDSADKEDEQSAGDDAQGGDEEPEEEAAQESSVEMTPQIDAAFAQLANERIAQHPFRYYVLLPLRRAHALWFNTHSDYYPFEGQLLPFEDLDYSLHQQYWLPLFSFMVLICSLLGVSGGWFLWQSGDLNSRLWVLLVALIVLLRIGFFATLENPEPRYVVEVFPFLSVLGGISLVRIKVALLRRNG